MTPDAERLWAAFRYVRNRSTGMALDLNVVYARAGFERTTPNGRISAQLALNELTENGLVVGTAPPKPEILNRRSERANLRRLGLQV